MNAKKRK